MSLLIDTSAWSLALRRDVRSDSPEVAALHRALQGDIIVVSRGVILQELLEGFVPARAQALILQRFADVPLVQHTPLTTHRDSSTPLRASACAFGGDGGAQQRSAADRPVTKRPLVGFEGAFCDRSMTQCQG